MENETESKSTQKIKTDCKNIILLCLTAILGYELILRAERIKGLAKIETLMVIFIVVATYVVLRFIRSKIHKKTEETPAIEKLNSPEIMLAKKTIEDYKKKCNEFRGDFGYMYDEELVSDHTEYDDHKYFELYKEKFFISLNSIRNTADALEELRKMYEETVKEAVCKIRTVEGEDEGYCINISEPKLRLTVKMIDTENIDCEYKYINLNENFLRKHLPDYEE